MTPDTRRKAGITAVNTTCSRQSQLTNYYILCLWGRAGALPKMPENGSAWRETGKGYDYQAK